ncbi:MAG: PepSY domain-containing protein [Armatimonadaceae bacterium]
MKKRHLYLLHRWLGIVLCIFFALWFISGVIMLYARMPLLFPSERYAGLETLDFARIQISPQQAWDRLGKPEANPGKARLVMSLNRPVYLFNSKGEKWQGIFADTGEQLEPVTVEQGAREAQRFLNRETLPVHVNTFDGIDQWTFSNSMNLHRPLHRYRFDDANRTEVYVSAVTGEVVNKTTQGERWSAAVGAYLHWLAPSLLRREVTVWRNFLLYLSLAGTILAVTGMVIGVLRYRREGYPNRTGLGAKLPYRGVMAWHAWTGLLFGVTTLTWIFSGFLYMNPGGTKSGPLSTVTTVTPYNEGGIRADLSPKPEQSKAFSGGALEMNLFQVLPGDAWATAKGITDATAPVKEVTLLRFAGKPYYLFHRTDTDSWLVSGATVSADAKSMFSVEELVAQAEKAVPGAKLTEATLLTEYDAYYYAVGAVAPKRLPILRLQYDDLPGTWLYVKPFDGSIFRRYDHHGRLMRWLVNGLHCLDFPFLIKNRPLWDIAIIGLSLGGLVLSVAGIIIGGKRLRMEMQTGKPKPAPRKSSSVNSSATINETLP